MNLIGIDFNNERYEQGWIFVAQLLVLVPKMKAIEAAALGAGDESPLLAKEECTSASIRLYIFRMEKTSFGKFWAWMAFSFGVADGLLRIMGWILLQM